MDINATSRAKTVDTGELYGRVRDRFIHLVSALDDFQLSTRVPATPLWSVHDAFAHVVGITADLNALEFGSGLDPDEWTARQVAQRRDHSISQMAAEWTAESPRFEEGLRLLGYEYGSHYVGDLHAHLQDCCAALGRGRDADAETVLVALDFYLFSTSQALADNGIAIDVTVGDEIHHLGRGPTRATLTGDAFSVLRALSGRRTAAQIAAMEWTGDAAAVIPVLSRYPLPDEALD